MECGPEQQKMDLPAMSRSPSSRAGSKYSSAHDQVYETLKRAILAGHFRPGERITIRSLAAQLDTSDTPVREALKRLVAERAIVATDTRKFEIPVLNSEQIDQIFELRIELEGMAAAQAAERVTGPELDTIWQEFRAMEKAVEHLDPEQLLLTNTRFHFVIYRASRNEILLPILESLWLQYAPTISEYVPELMNRLSPHDREQLYEVSLAEHKHIIAALENRDSGSARKRVQADLRIFRDAAEAAGHHIGMDYNKRRTVADYSNLWPNP